MADRPSSNGLGLAPEPDEGHQGAVGHPELNGARGDVWVSPPFDTAIEPPPPWSTQAAPPPPWPPVPPPPAPAPEERDPGTPPSTERWVTVGPPGAPAARSWRTVPAFAPVPPPPTFRQPAGPRREVDQAPPHPADVAPPDPADVAPPDPADVAPPDPADVAPPHPPTDPLAAPPGGSPPEAAPASAAPAANVNLKLTGAQLQRLLALLEGPVPVPGPLSPAGAPDTTRPAAPPPAGEVARSTPVEADRAHREWQAALRRAREEAEQAKAVALEMHRRLLATTKEQERARYRADGLPPELLELAEPLLGPELHATVDVGTIVRRMLDFVRDRYCAAGEDTTDAEELVAQWEIDRRIGGTGSAGTDPPH